MTAAATTAAKNDPFSRRRPPPIEEDFATINAKRGATFEEARQAYREAAQRAHPDRGGDVETMQRINIAWDRIKQSFGR
jgi:DnaJ-class molecular chaperone